jgi:glyoxylase-like metal-dependent hydrolase (beta-lactamase superfamily II)
MADIMKINAHIHRITLPYKDIFTTVYTLDTPKGAVLFDAGSFDEDLDAYILPLLAEAGISADRLKYVFISHNHKDHSGGLPKLLEKFPHLQIVSHSKTLQERYTDRFLLPEEGALLLDTFRVVSIPGHTADSCALLDIRTLTLITGDCLQQWGIRGSGDWASNISYPAEHAAALEKIRNLGIEQIITAHDYVPHGYRADGNEAALQMLDACLEPLERLACLIKSNPALDDGQIRALYNDAENHLTINVRVVGAMRAALQNQT